MLDSNPNLVAAAIGTKGDVIPAPESELEYDSRPFSTPDSGPGSFALESLVPVPSLVPAPWVNYAQINLYETLYEMFYHQLNLAIKAT